TRRRGCRHSRWVSSCWPVWRFWRSSPAAGCRITSRATFRVTGLLARREGPDRGGATSKPPMSFELAIVLVLLATAIAMFAINRPRMDAVGLIMLTALPLTGVITMGEALAGFSDSTIVLLGALFVIGEGLVRTGVAQRLGDWLNAKAGSSERRLLI